MKKIDTIVVAPHFYTMEGAGVGYHSDAAMAVDGGKILKVGNRPEILAEYTAEEMITLDHHMVLPGFIDGHMHTACNIMRGLAQDTNSWMMFGLQPFDNAVNDEERDAGSRVAILEAVRAGTTTLGDYDSKMENVCAFIDKVGARGNIAQTIRAAKRRVYQPGELYEFDDAMGDESLNRNIDLYNNGTTRPGDGLRSCLARKALTLSARRCCCVSKRRSRSGVPKSICMCSKEIERPIRSSSAMASVLQLFWMSWAIWMNLLLQSILLTVQMRKLPLLPNEVPQ